MVVFSSIKNPFQVIFPYRSLFQVLLLDGLEKHCLNSSHYWECSNNAGWVFERSGRLNMRKSGVCYFLMEESVEDIPLLIVILHYLAYNCENREYGLVEFMLESRADNNNCNCVFHIDNWVPSQMQPIGSHVKAIQLSRQLLAW